MAIGTLGGLDDYTYINQTKSDSLEKSLQSNAITQDEESLLNACKEFEAYFVEQMFKEMKKTIPQAENISSTTSSMKDYYEEMLYQNYAKACSDNDNLGLAQSLFEQMKRSYGL